MSSYELKRRYSNFLENKEYHLLGKALERKNKFSIVRVLNPSNPNSSRQRFYNTNMMQEFDKHYERRKKD
jgi:hypothetical protein